GPDLLRDERAGENASRVLHEYLEQRVFTAREVDGVAVDLNRVAQEIDADAAMLEQNLLYRGLPSDQRAHPRQQLLKAERLRKVVIGTDIEPLYAVLHRVAGTQDEHGLVESARAPLPQQVDAIAVGQPQIEHDDVVRGLSEGVEGILACAHPADRIGALL